MAKGKESMYGQNCGLSMLTHDHNLNSAQNEKRIEFFTSTVFDQSGFKTHNKKGLTYREILTLRIQIL